MCQVYKVLLLSKLAALNTSIYVLEYLTATKYKLELKIIQN